VECDVSMDLITYLYDKSYGRGLKADTILQGFQLFFSRDKHGWNKIIEKAEFILPQSTAGEFQSGWLFITYSCMTFMNKKWCSVDRFCTCCNDHATRFWFDFGVTFVVGVLASFGISTINDWNYSLLEYNLDRFHANYFRYAFEKLHA